MNDKIAEQSELGALFNKFVECDTEAREIRNAALAANREYQTAALRAEKAFNDYVNAKIKPQG